jgi:hypothetical protein
MARANSVAEYLAMASEAKGKPDRIHQPRLKHDKGRVFPAPTEHDEQVALFQWAERIAVSMPPIRLLYAIANAGAGAQRGRAGYMKAEGVRAGVPDICLPVARGGHHGLYIELKALDGATREAQMEWLVALDEEGYYVMICYGFAEARDTILAYLAGEYVRAA